MSSDVSYSKAISEWSWSPSNPTAPLRCVILHTDGTRCDKAAIPGATKCLTHGASEVQAAQVVQAAQNRLVGLVDQSIDTMSDIMRNSLNDSARLKAATEVLDRVGVKQNDAIDVNINDNRSVSDAVAAKLDSLVSPDIFVDDDDDEEIIGEVVTDSADPETSSDSS